MEKNIKKLIMEIEGVSNFHERAIFSSGEDINHYEFAFDFSDMKYLGSQIDSPLFTLNRFNLLFRFTLKKETTKLNLLEAINKYNSERPLIKVAVTEMTGKNFEVTFTSDFINEDNAMLEMQLLPLINIMAPCPADFVTFLNQKKIPLVHK